MYRQAHQRAPVPAAAELVANMAPSNAARGLGSFSEQPVSAAVDPGIPHVPPAAEPSADPTSRAGPGSEPLVMNSATSTGDDDDDDDHEEASLSGPDVSAASPDSPVRIH